jgi:hypothetical protein
MMTLFRPFAATETSVFPLYHRGDDDDDDELSSSQQSEFCFGRSSSLEVPAETV